MSIRALLRGGNARHLVDTIFLAFPRLRTREMRDQLLFALLKAATPIGLVVALLLAAGPEPGNLLAAASVP
ncbi:MAG: hypothetical protein KJZ98_07035 [Burkholderiaceae bacterium]|nr:hypothetical protein [Burkholderiaceae bacterium]MEB2351636.1 hypothetical protein [Burkholderiaceae bacterium]